MNEDLLQDRDLIVMREQLCYSDFIGLVSELSLPAGAAGVTFSLPAELLTADHSSCGGYRLGAEVVFSVCKRDLIHKTCSNLIPL